MALVLQRQDVLDRAALAVFFRHKRCVIALIFQHRQGVHGDVGTGGGIRRGRQIIGIGFAGHLEHGNRQRCRHFRLAGEPLSIGPALQHGLCIGIAGLGFFLHIVEGIEHQQGVLQCIGCGDTNFSIVQQLHQGRDVVATQHGAQQFGGAGASDQRVLLAAKCNRRQIRRLDLGGIVHAGRHAIDQQLKQKLSFTCRRSFQ